MSEHYKKIRINEVDGINKSFYKNNVMNNVIFVLKNMIYYDKFMLLLIPVGIVCAPIMKYLWSFMSKYIIDLITDGDDIRSFILMILVFAFIQLSATMLQTFFSKETTWRCTRIYNKMVKELAFKVMKIHYENLEDPQILDSYHKAQNACGGKNGVNGMMRTILEFFTSLSVFFVGVFILGRINVTITIIMTIVAVLNFLMLTHAANYIKVKILDLLAPWHRKYSYVHKQIMDFKSAKDIRIYGAADWFVEKVKEYNKIFFKATKKKGKVTATVSLISAILRFFLQVAVYLWLIKSFIRKEITLGDFSLYTTMAFTFFDCFSSVLNSVSGIITRSREIDDYRYFLDRYKEDIGVGKKVPTFSSYEFVFEDVSFCYPNSQRMALKNLNLTIKSGERLAVVGLNGAGKTTLIKLLLRLYEPTEGRILLNGVDVKEYDRVEYYKIFAPVFQDGGVFAFSLAENVSMGEPEKEKVKQCLMSAGLGTKLESLPRNIDTEVLRIFCEDGIDLSGGEKQKLALARALYKNAPVVILDEPTAALDPIAEGKLYEEFDNLINAKTAIYISHRLSSTQFCSYVAMFDNGRMVEYGTHTELLNKKGVYAKLFNMQAKYYTEEIKKVGETLC